jgi:hypothetical protein
MKLNLSSLFTFVLHDFLTLLTFFLLFSYLIKQNAQLTKEITSDDFALFLEWCITGNTQHEVLSYCISSFSPPMKKTHSLFHLYRVILCRIWKSLNALTIQRSSFSFYSPKFVFSLCFILYSITFD